MILRMFIVYFISKDCDFCLVDILLVCIDPVLLFSLLTFRQKQILLSTSKRYCRNWRFLLMYIKGVVEAWIISKTRSNDSITLEPKDLGNPSKNLMMHLGKWQIMKRIMIMISMLVCVLCCVPEFFLSLAPRPFPCVSVGGVSWRRDFRVAIWRSFSWIKLRILQLNNINKVIGTKTVKMFKTKFS